ncbi:MAG: peptidoglycan DD-metalloendopeptidase family protein [Sphingobacteriaceae bacterium]|nr:peptidoglycan DD-metalloendopeptidase family protein [Sphingobacteriaceae bacterium]
MKRYKIFLWILLVSFAFTAVAQESKELKRKKEALQRDIERLEKEAAVAAKGKKMTLAQINALKAQINIRQQKIGVINSQVANLSAHIAQNTHKVENLKSQLSVLKKEYANTILFAQRNQNAYSKMMFVFGAEDFNQAFKRVKYLQQFGQYRKKQAGYIEVKKSDLNTEIVILDKNKKEKKNLLNEEVQEKVKLDKNKKVQVVALNQYKATEKQYQKDIQKRRQQQAAIDREIRAAIRREIEIARRKAEAEEREAERFANAKAKAENKPAPAAKPKKSNTNFLNATPEMEKLSNAFEGNKGSLPWPVQHGQIAERFGKHKVDQATIDNQGIIIETPESENVRAVFSGTVASVTLITGRYMVLIKHGGYFTIYHNLKTVSVSAGTKVGLKQSIGEVGNTGETPLLQFQIWKASNPVNPEHWIAK